MPVSCKKITVGTPLYQNLYCHVTFILNGTKIYSTLLYQNCTENFYVTFIFKGKKNYSTLLYQNCAENFHVTFIFNGTIKLQSM